MVDASALGYRGTEYAGRPPETGTVLSVHTVVADVRTRPSRSLGTVDEVRLDTECRAHRAGWPAVHVPGLYPAAVLSDLLAEQYGAERIRSLDIQFRSPSWLGDRLRRGLDSTVRIAAGMLRAELACVRESDGATITTAVATLVE